jgi:hypothetical protein
MTNVPDWKTYECEIDGWDEKQLSVELVDITMEYARGSIDHDDYEQAKELLESRLYEFAYGPIDSPTSDDDYNRAMQGI